jgi:hypothetical protein
LVEVSNNKELNRIQKKNISEIISNAQVKILKTSYFPLKDSMIRSLDNIQADFTSGNLASANKRLIAYQKYIAPLIYLSTKLDF